MKNPANLAKHQANPKVAPVIAKMMSKFGGAGAGAQWSILHVCDFSILGLCSWVFNLILMLIMLHF